MSALTAARVEPREASWHERKFPLNGGSKAFAGGIACLDTSDGVVRPAASATTQIPIGIFQEDVDNTSGADGDLSVNVALFREVKGRWFVNDPGGGAVAAAHVGQDCFLLDDQTVTMTATGASKAGRVWAVATRDGVSSVFVEPMPFESVLAPTPALPAFAAGDTAPASIVAGGIYDIPTTAAASTVTLPAASPDGTIAYFFADGVKNGHTVQYRDATGPVNLTAALTLSKRHLAIASKLGGKWAVTVTAAP